MVKSSRRGTLEKNTLLANWSTALFSAAATSEPGISRANWSSNASMRVRTSWSPQVFSASLSTSMIQMELTRDVGYAAPSESTIASCVTNRGAGGCCWDSKSSPGASDSNGAGSRNRLGCGSQ